jgi:hypothetical protein
VNKKRENKNFRGVKYSTFPDYYPAYQDILHLWTGLLHVAEPARFKNDMT